MIHKRHVLLSVVCLWLTIIQEVTAMSGRYKAEFTKHWLADSDSDGVVDSQDLCPGTLPGVAVNAYGCPVTVAQCEYNTATVTLASAGGSSGGSTKYVLADNTGKILQISNTPTFTGLTGAATYMALALTYDGSVSNLSIGQSLSGVSATCLDWSDALVFKACITPSTCDYQVGQTITLKTTGGSSGTGLKTSYVLTDANGKLLQISTTPSFSTSGLTAGTYQAYALTYNNDNTVTHLAANGTNNLNQVTASCLDWSDALLINVCAPTPPACDYQVGQTITLKTSGGSSGTGIKTSYVLTDASGKLVQVSTTPSFSTSGLTTGTYQAYALTYNNDNTITHLAANGTNNLSQVTASCLDWSDALVITICAPTPPACDYQIGQTITLKTTGGSSGAGLKTSYVLTDANGKLLVVSTTPSFFTSGLTAGTYQAYALIYTNDNTITHLVANGTNKLSQVTASCLAQSSVQVLTLCGNCKPICMPILIARKNR
ncbi:hypothetical protein GO755_16415 [Spirosoma sp. HMF4905]|uniref:Uncharacterized protein n=1 Tax=Spirosoma arboris TaxID=2682092 RepID=A0A7K1SCU6_9BACT|nr:hypothetical protein [Spirosoma arboris]MVM31632.1 hypothetical protein [Spirosoma arboris]